MKIMSKFKFKDFEMHAKRLFEMHLLDEPMNFESSRGHFDERIGKIITVYITETSPKYRVALRLNEITNQGNFISKADLKNLFRRKKYEIKL